MTTSDKRSRVGTLKNEAANASRSSPYDLTFETTMQNQGIFMPRVTETDDMDIQVPDNAEQIRNFLVQKRPSVDNLRITDFNNFNKHVARAAGEAKAQSLALPLLTGPSEESLHYTGQSVVFNNLDVDIKDVTTPKPDIFYGAKPETILSKIRTDFSKSIVPCSNSQFPNLPNFFVEFKGETGTQRVATRQAMNDGAWTIPGIERLLDATGQRSPSSSPHDAQALSVTCVEGSLTVFAQHFRPSTLQPGKQLLYMNALASANMQVESFDKFKEAVTLYRNARDWAKGRRDAIITAANAYYSRPAPAAGPSVLARTQTARANRWRQVASDRDELALSSSPSEDDLLAAGSPIRAYRPRDGTASKKPRRN